jgi:DNA (cytosine-5)-methyltransferase 1
MNYLSICSGIESCSVAWNPLGWKPIGFSEIEEFRSAVLKYHYPEVKNYGDFTKITKQTIGTKPDILVGGTPCATFSIAGLRKGLGEDRGNLALEFIRLIDRIKPKWIVWENVNGILSSNGGKDLATFLGALAELRYGFAYRVLDTQYVRTSRFPRAIPQRRRRIFVIGHYRDWRNPAKVLFNQEPMPENPYPSRRKKKRTSDKSKKNITENLVVIRDSHTKSNGAPWSEKDVSFTLTANDIPSITVMETSTPDKTARIYKDEVSPTLTAMTGGNRQPIVFGDKIKTIRRLTPIECERLQGLPDNYTQIPYRGKPKEQAPVSKRYEAIGRAMSINVMEWLGTRIQKVHNNV